MSPTPDQVASATPHLDRDRDAAVAALHARIEHDFTYHPPKGDQPQRYEAIRMHARDLAHAIVDLTPISRAQSTALTALEQVVFNANAAIARNE